MEDYKAAVLILNRCYLLLGLLTTSSYPTPSSGLALQNTPRLQSKSNPSSWLWARYQVSLLWGNKEELSVYVALNKADTALALHRKGLICRDAKNPDVLHTIVEYESTLRSLLIRLTGVCSFLYSSVRPYTSAVFTHASSSPYSAQTNQCLT